MLPFLIFFTLVGILFLVGLAKLAEKLETIYTIQECKEPPPALAWEAPWQPRSIEGVYERAVPGIAAQVFAWARVLCHLAAGGLALLLAGELAYWFVKNPELIRVVIQKTPGVLCGTVILISVARFFILLCKELLHPPRR